MEEYGMHILSGDLFDLLECAFYLFLWMEIFDFLYSCFIKGMCVVDLVPTAISRRRMTFQTLVMMLLERLVFDGSLGKSFVCKFVVVVQYVNSINYMVSSNVGVSAGGC